MWPGLGAEMTSLGFSLQFLAVAHNMLVSLADKPSP